MKEKDPFDSSHLLRKFLLDYLYSTNQTFAFDFLGNIASGMRVFVVPITEISRQSFFRDGIESSPFEVIFSTNLHLDLELPASTRRQLSGQLSTFLEACWADYDNLVKHLDEKGKEYDSNDLMALARSQTLLVHAIDLFADQVVSEVINPYGLRDQSLKELTQYEETRNEE